MKLVDDDCIKRTKERFCCCRSPQQHCLDRFRGDQDHTGGCLDEFALGPLGGITVPTNQRQFELVAQFFKPTELIVDQCLKRSDV